MQVLNKIHLVDTIICREKQVNDMSVRMSNVHVEFQKKMLIHSCEERTYGVADV